MTSVCFSPNGRFVLASSLDNCIRLWDYVAGSVKKTYQGHQNEKFSIGGCFGALDHLPFVASASEDGGIVLWDVKSKDILQKVNGHQGVCFWVDICEDLMVSAGQDKTIRVYRHKRVENGVNGSFGHDHVEPFTAEDVKHVSQLPIRSEDVKMEGA